MSAALHMSTMLPSVAVLPSRARVVAGIRFRNQARLNVSVLLLKAVTLSHILETVRSPRPVSARSSLSFSSWVFPYLLSISALIAGYLSTLGGLRRKPLISPAVALSRFEVTYSYFVLSCLMPLTLN